MNLHKLRADLRAAFARVSALYATNSTTSRMEKFLLLTSCLITSFILAFLLLLALRLPLKLSVEVCVALTGVFWLCIALAMCFSTNVRCFGLLFLMSISLKQGKKLLLMAGTMIVILQNIQNMLGNLKGLAKSLVCNVEEKLLAIDMAPLSNYIHMLKRVASCLDQLLPNVLGDIKIHFDLKPSVQSGNFTKKIVDVHRALNKTIIRATVVIADMSSIGKDVLPAVGVVLLVVTTVLYLKKFRSNPKHKKFLITKNFLKYDEKQRLQGKPSVLPLSKKESKRYIMVPSVGLTKKEGKAMLKFGLPILTHSVAWLFFVGLDVIVYHIIVRLNKRLEELQPLHIPILLNMQEGTFLFGIPINHRQMGYNFSYSMPIFEKKCLPVPELWLHRSLLPLLGIFCLLLLLVLLSSKLDQLRLVVSEGFYAEEAEKRIAAIHAKILKRRTKWKAKDAKAALKSLTTKLSFWFPLIFHHQKKNAENTT